MVWNCTPQMPTRKPKAFKNEIPIVTKSNGNQAGLPRKAKIEQRLEIIACARSGTSVFPM
jgi:hypothetical protein